MTQRDLSEKSGVAQTRISDIETGRAKAADPHLSEALALVDALGGDVREALGLSGEVDEDALRLVALYQRTPVHLRPALLAAIEAFVDAL